MSKTILIAGGSGTLANAILPLILTNESVRQIRILSRGEHHQASMQQRFNDPRISWLLGDVSDYNRVEIACRGVDEVYNFAAMKRVEAAQYNPSQAVKTNVIGSMSIVNACIKNNVPKAIYVSTDKAVSPHTIYGASKYLGEQLHLSGNIGRHNSKFSSVLYGNVWCSQGSVIEKWIKQKKAGERLTVTNSSMTRFFITQRDAALFVYKAMQCMDQGECFIPRMKSAVLLDIVDTLGCEFDVIGNRSNEKMDEILFSKDESHLIRTLDDCFIRYPENPPYSINKRGDFYSGHEYSSLTAPRFSVEELKEMLDAHSM